MLTNCDQMTQNRWKSVNIQPPADLHMNINSLDQTANIHTSTLMTGEE